MIYTDMNKARDIWRHKLRAARAEKLSALDVAFMRAVEANDENRKAEIVAEKDFLRNLPAAQEIEDAKTPNELKDFWPL